MKLFYLVIICLVLSCIEASAQMLVPPYYSIEALIVDSIAKKCHVKTVTWQNDYENNFTRTYTENYDTDGKLIERITSDDFYDSSKIHIIQPWYLEFFYYNSNHKLITEQDINYTYHTLKADTTTYYTTNFLYDKNNRLVKKYYIDELKKDRPPVITTWSYRGHRKIEHSSSNTIIYKYNSKGQKFEQKFKKSNYMAMYLYDHDGRIDSTVDIGDDSTKFIITAKYNNNGQCIKQACYSLKANGKTLVQDTKEETNCTYDNRGLLIKETNFPLRQHYTAHPINYIYTFTYTFY